MPNLIFTDIIRILVGVLLLTLGRKIYWIFVGLIGFEVGFFLAERLFSREPLLALIVAIFAGLAGALLAVFLQQVAIWLGGFLAGGYFVVTLLEVLGARPVQFELLFLILFLAGGVIGVILVAFLFNWALIVLSSLAGASLIVRVVLPASPSLAVVLFAILSVAGIVIQVILMQRE